MLAHLAAAISGEPRTSPLSRSRPSILGAFLLLLAVCFGQADPIYAQGKASKVWTDEELKNAAIYEKKAQQFAGAITLSKIWAKDSDERKFFDSFEHEEQPVMVAILNQDGTPSGKDKRITAGEFRYSMTLLATIGNIDKIDEKIKLIEKSMGSTALNADQKGKLAAFKKELEEAKKLAHIEVYGQETRPTDLVALAKGRAVIKEAVNNMAGVGLAQPEKKQQPK